MAYVTMKSVVLLILLAASIVPNSAARIGMPSPSVTLSSSMPVGQFSGEAPGLHSIIEIPASTSTALKYDSGIPSVFDHVRNFFRDRRSPDGTGRQEPSNPASFTVSSTNITITTITIPSTSTFSPPVSAPPEPSSPWAAPISSATSTVTETVSGIVILFTTIVSSEIESAIGTLPLPSFPSATSVAPPASFICTEAFCTPSSSTISWTCPDTVGCGLSTTLASYSCSTGFACTLIPVTTTWSCSIPLAGNICTTAVPLVPLPSSGVLPTSIPGATGGTPPTPLSLVSTASGNIQSATKSSNPTSGGSSSGTGGSSPASNATPTAAAITTAASDATCSDASCCPYLWDCISVSTASANVLTGLACPSPAVVGKVTGHSWAINCVPSSLSNVATKTDFSNNNACPPYKTCVLPSTVSFQTDGNTGGTTGNALQSVVEVPCSGSVAVCTSAFPSLTQLDKPSCMVGEVPGFSSLCDQCSTMKFPEDCPVIEDVSWPTTGYYYCACSKDSTGLALNAASGPSGASPSCSGWNYTSTTEVVGSATVTTSYNPFWDTCDQLDVKTSCGTAASCSTMVRYEAESSMVTYILNGVTYTTLIFWWTCKSDLCNVKWWENLINAFCRFIGICHIPLVSGDGFPRPPWPDVPPMPDPAGFTSDPEGKKTAPSSGSSSTTSSSSCSANTVTDIIVYCYNTTISGGVFTTGCSTTSSFATGGCSLSPITTTTTEPACSVGVVTVTDIGVRCFNITDSVGGFTLTCNQTSTYLSTGCTLTPTTSTDTEDAPACSLSPNYDDPAILSDLSVWLQQFPLTLPPDTVNFNFTTTTPNATLPPSKTSAGWTSIKLITTTVTGTNPTAAATEVLSESIDLWGGVTTVISGSITDYINATSSSTLVEATISTITPVPTFVTTTRTTTSVEGTGKTVVVSEVEIIYGIQSSDPLGTSTSILTHSDVSKITATPSDLVATTLTNSFGEVESEEIGVVGTSTVTVSISIISTISDAITGVFGSSEPAPPTFPSPTYTTAGFTSCDIWTPNHSPTAKAGAGVLGCQFDTSPNRIDYSKIDWADPVNGAYWLLPEGLVRNGSYVEAFCNTVFGPYAPHQILAPVEGCNPSIEPSESELYTNTVRRSYNGETDVVVDTFDKAHLTWSGVDTAHIEVTFSVTYDPLCGLVTDCEIPLLPITSNYCINIFANKIAGLKPDVAACRAQAGIDAGLENIPSPGGTWWASCLIFTMAAVVVPPIECPAYVPLTTTRWPPLPTDILPSGMTL